MLLQMGMVFIWEHLIPQMLHYIIKDMGLVVVEVWVHGSS
nr:MAG TPA: hypothetical protein [Caudoviricetes sp.]